jgi:hypothetical protein
MKQAAVVAVKAALKSRPVVPAPDLRVLGKCSPARSPFASGSSSSCCCDSAKPVVHEKTEEGKEAASAALVQLLPTAPLEHHEQLDLLVVQEPSEEILSQALVERKW